MLLAKQRWQQCPHVKACAASNSVGLVFHPRTSSMLRNTVTQHFWFAEHALPGSCRVDMTCCRINTARLRCEHQALGARTRRAPCGAS